METNEKSREDLLLKIKEQAYTLTNLLRKNRELEQGKNLPRNDLLGLKNDILYLLITAGRRIVGKVIFENKSFVCYTKREGTKYYVNKNNIDIIKELSDKEIKSYKISNFNEDEKD